jgi:AcrR family transcriptional regulator
VAIDRRVLRTRTALFDALVALIRQKDFAEITVEDIIAAANVGRSTFYAHFASRDDLLARSLERLRDLLLAASADGGQLSVSEVFFLHVAEYADVGEALRSGKGHLLLWQAIDGVLLNVLRQILPQRGPNGMPRELALRHVVATLGTALSWWLQQKRTADPLEAEALFRRLIEGSLPRDFLQPFLGPSRGGRADAPAGDFAPVRLDSQGAARRS